MVPRHISAILATCAALSACQKSAEDPAAPPSPEPTATVVRVVEVPTPAPSASSAATLEVTPQATACGSEKLQNYLNLLPTATAKDEIAKTLGHNRVRYVALQEAKASAAPGSTRVTAGLGADGRIKEFGCG